MSDNAAGDAPLPTYGERRTLSRTLGYIGLHLEPPSMDYILFIARAWARLADDVCLAGDIETAIELTEIAYLSHDLGHPGEAASLPADDGKAVTAGVTIARTLT
jgi:hypothetical protein